MRALLGWLLSAIAITLLIVGFGLEYLALRGGEFLGDGQLWVMLAGLVVLGVGGLLFKTARRLGAVSGETILARDDRPIVTYLRSFKADSRADVAPNQRTSARLAGLVTPSVMHSRKTEEEEIALALAPIGPLLAIGRPGEILPQLGAHRVYTDDDSWRDMVAQLLDRSALVLMRAGETEGFWWEVAHVRDRFAPEHVVVLLPRKQRDYEAFRARVQPHLARPLPDYEPGLGDASFGGLLWFESDWTPHIERTRMDINVARHGIAADLTRMLRPVLARLAILPPVRAGWRARGKAALIDLALVFGPLILASLIAPALGETAATVLMTLVIASIVAVLGLDLIPRLGSPGKLASGLRVVDAAGFPPRVPQLLLRQLVRVTGLPLVYTYLSIALVARGQRAIHDRMFGTDVVDIRNNRDPVAPPPAAANLVPA